MKELVKEDWTTDIKICTCEDCGKRYYYSTKLERVLTDGEINDIAEDED